MTPPSEDSLRGTNTAIGPPSSRGPHDAGSASGTRGHLGRRPGWTRMTVSCLLFVSLVLTPAAPVHAQDLDRAVGALIGAIIGGAIQEHQRQRQQTTRQPQRAQPARPAVSQAQRQQTRDVQTALNFFGFPAGAVDGAMGPNTRNAIRAYQQAMGFPVTGTLDATQRDFLIGSYHRARHAGAIPGDSGILQQQGPQGLLRVYRDEMRGVHRAEFPPSSTTTAISVGQDTFWVPELGTSVRSAILDSMRPYAEQVYGVPVEFVVRFMRVSEDKAFVALTAQRPGGVAINLHETPGYRRGDIQLDRAGYPVSGDAGDIQGMLRQTTMGWQLYEWAYHPSEAWWIAHCNEWFSVLPGACPRSGVQIAAPGLGVAESTPQQSNQGLRRRVNGFANQGIHYTIDIEARRVEGGAVVQLHSAAGQHNPNSNFNSIDEGRRFGMGLHVVTRQLCEGCRPGFVRQSPEALRYENGRIVSQDLPIEVFVPDSALEGADEIGIALYGDNLLFLAENSSFTISDLRVASAEGAARTAQHDRRHEQLLFGPHAVIDPELDTYRCLRTANRDAFAECLRAAGASEPAIRAAIALSRDGANVYIVEYFDIGAVDVAVLEWPAAGVGITYGFVVGNLEFLPAGELFRPMDIRDGASRSLARRHPRAAAMNVIGVAGHRFLDDGGQRFVLTTPLTDGCRACDIVGTAIGYVDFRSGRVVESGTIGWAAQLVQASRDGAEVHRRLAARDVREMQTQLNLNGYIAGAMDGAFGPNTARALRDFRREHCLGDDAEWTQQTADLLAGQGGGKYLPAVPAPCGLGPRPGAMVTAADTARDASPLREGIYAEHPGQCPFSGLPAPDIATLSMVRPLSVSESHLAWDHAGCEILSQRQSGSTFTFDLSCTGEGHSWRTTQSIERLNDTDVRFQGILFRHCGQTPEPQRAGPDGRVPLPVQEGVYASLPEACPAFDGTPRSEAQQSAASFRVVLRDGEYRRGEESCPIVEYTEANGLGRLGMGCMYGDTPVIFNFQLNPLGPDRFEHNGAVYQLCREPVGDGIDIMADGGTAPQAPRVDPLETMRLTAGFFDAGYLASQNRQHLGADYVAPVGTPVRSPVTGIVVSNNTNRTDDADLKRIIIRDDATGHEHVLGHIDSDLEESATVRQGEIVGAIVAAGTGPHLHWGINRTGVAAAIGEGWGWGRAPSRATIREAATRGWIDPEQYREVAARSGADPEQPPAPLAGNPEASLDQLRLAAGFLDPEYTARHGKRLLGVDLRGDAGTVVLAPISGMVMGNRTEPPVPVEEKWLILRDPSTGQEHVFGHLVSPLEPGQEIRQGEPLGQIAGGREGHRIHWGINRFGIWQAIDTATGWGWGHGPAVTDAEQVRARGWIDPATRFSAPPAVVPELPDTNVVEPEAASVAAHRYPRAEDFASEFPDEWRQLRAQFSQAVAEELAHELLGLMEEFGLRPVMRALWDAPGDAFAGFLRQVDPAEFSADVLYGLIGPKVARFAVEDYARRTGAEVDTELVLGLSSVTAQLTLAALTGKTPWGLPIMSFNYSRRMAMRPYEEDERFEIVSEALLAADQFRRMADSLDADGKPHQATEIREFADNIVAHAAEQSILVFRGADGPVVAELLHGMDEVIRLVRADRPDEADRRFWELHRRAEGAAPGFFSLSTNNWYQRYFMIGPQRQGGTVRAFRQLDDILQRVLQSDVEAPPPSGVESPPVALETDAGSEEQLSAIETHFTSALGVDSDYVQLQLIDAGFHSGDLAPFGPDGRHSQWTPEVQQAFEAALKYARENGIIYDLSSESGYYAFVDNVRAHRLAHVPDNSAMD